MSFLCGEKEGERKVILTKMALFFYTLVCLAYLGVSVATGSGVSPDFIPWVSMGYAAISGGSFAANAAEHRFKNKLTN